METRNAAGVVKCFGLFGLLMCVQLTTDTKAEATTPGMTTLGGESSQPSERLIDRTALHEVPAHLDYFPSVLHAAVYRNWDIVPPERLATVLGTSVPNLMKLGSSLGLSPPPALTPEVIRRNHETVLRRNWPVIPRRQIEALLDWKPADLDHFLATDIAFRVLLGDPPPDLLPVKYREPDSPTTARTAWFAERIRKHRKEAADAKAEPRLAFINELLRVHDPADRIPEASPRKGDADLRHEWTISLPKASGALANASVQGFVACCADVHHTHGISVTTESAAMPERRTIALSHNPTLGDDEAFCLDIASDSIRVEVTSDRAIARAFIELERRMAERGGPFLAPTSGPLLMRPSFNPRFVYPYFAPMTDVLGQDVVDPCPDGYLARVAHQDANGIWLFCVLEDLVPSPVFENMGSGGVSRLERLRSIVARAARHGLQVFLYFNEPRAQPLEFFGKHPNLKGHVEGGTAALCTSTDAVRRHMRGSFERLMKEVPGLGGIFIITASENLTHCYAHGTGISCERCLKRKPEEVAAELVDCTIQGVKAGSPDADVMVWDWSWHSVGMKDPQEEIVGVLKSGCGLMADFERGTKIERGGVPMTVDEYSISVVGPSPRALLRAEQAKRYGIDFLAKIQLSCTWECGTVPFIPVPGLLAEKAKAMRNCGVKGCMQSWTLGSCPSPNTDAFAIQQWNPGLSVDETLRRVAARRYGESAVDSAVRGWTVFGKTFSEQYPFSAAIYNGPIQYAPGLPWYRRQIPLPYGKGAMLNPKDDWKIWTSPYTASQMAAQLRRMCEGWSAGLADLERVIGEAANPRKRTARLDYGVAWIVDYTFRSFANSLDFYQARESGNHDEMRRLAAVELTATQNAYRYVLEDSRLGWEAQLQYYYQPSDVLEKLVALEAVIAPTDTERP